MPDMFRALLPSIPRFPACQWLRLAASSDGALPLTAHCCGGCGWRLAFPREQLARESGVSLKTIGKLEHKSRPRCYLRTCMSIAAALGIDPKGIAVTHNRGM